MKVLLGVAAAVAIVIPLVAVGDVGPPAHLQITEREPGLYAVQWRVPKALPPRAVPAPEFPETCRPTSERTVLDQPGAWLLAREWRCESCIAGQVVGMRYPFPDLSLTTVVRVDLLSGDRLAHVLTPGEGPWRLPEGTAAPDWVLAARRAVVAGVSHVLGSWVHLAFLFVIGVLGGSRQTIRLASAFTLGQVAGVLWAGYVIGMGAVPAQIGFALGVVIVARQALEPAEARRRLAILVGAAGLIHGLGIAALLTLDLGEEGARVPGQLIAVLGMDAAHLVGGVAVALLWARVSRRPAGARVRQALVYAAGAASMALCMALAIQVRVAQTGAVASSLQVPVGSGVSPTTAVAGSQRVAPAAPDAPVQSFLAVEPLEVRHEAMLRLAGLTQELGLDAESTLDIEAQPEILERLAQLVLESASVRVDGEIPQALLRRADFMTVDPTGALPRPNPIPEAVGEAVVGVVVAYPTAAVPRTVSLRWARFPTAVATVPTTVIDPEGATSRKLTTAEPSLTWENTLAEDPLPTVAAIEVEPVTLPLPWLSLPLLALSALLTFAAIRGRRATLSLAAARVLLALAFMVGPLLQTAVALPESAGRTPSRRQARRILAGLLPNIYRAMEFRDEATIYDRLAVSVTGETLSDVYLEQRRTLEVEERGGAQARVEAVEIVEAEDIQSREHGFGVRSTWTVGGMVTHFGHRHFRQNRYNAWIEIVPVDGTWKIQRIEVLEQERVR